ncbi:cytidine/deoxycytidylate deaminase family protein [Candidatus Microgenomates bacterium]|nr:cytidine/deoxycytidylate deaminase family protein [Candidatus Microgenomates bacterium]
MNKRPSWDQYFMELAEVVKHRADCLRLHVGAVIVKDKRIIATGYNGTPHGVQNCTEGGCERCKRRDDGKIGPGEEKGACLCLHAEQNAIIQSAYQGSTTKDATLYSTYAPCTQCAKMIINAGIVRVVCGRAHDDEYGTDLLRAAGIKVELSS